MTLQESESAINFVELKISLYRTLSQGVVFDEFNNLPRHPVSGPIVESTWFKRERRRRNEQQSYRREFADSGGERHNINPVPLCHTVE